MTVQRDNPARVIVVGVDENGLGPLLGPLVTTAVTLDVECYQAGRLRRIGERIGVHDSKQTAGFGQMAWTESVVLALMEQLHGQVPRTFDELLTQLSLDSCDVLQMSCPQNAHAQCWSAALTLPALNGDAREGEGVLRRFARANIVVTRVRSALACAGTLNRSFALGGTRVAMDLALFERLLLDARAQQTQDVHAICGMVGGIRDYPEYFRALSPEHVTEGKHTKLRRAYQVRGLGELQFVIDADALHLPVGLASMVGKYVRELSMERQNRFYRQHDATLTTGSGYHDPVTKRFVAASAALRRRLQIVDGCFLR